MIEESKKNDLPLLSIITIVLNGENNLEKTILSIINQLIQILNT